jgi:hypothetical protein
MSQALSIIHKSGNLLLATVLTSDVQKILGDFSTVTELYWYICIISAISRTIEDNIYTCLCSFARCI